MIVGAGFCGVLILFLGFITNNSESPPTQALLFGGMFLIAAGYGRLWRWHGIGAATVVSLLALIGFVDSIAEGIKSLTAGVSLSAVVSSQVIAALAVGIYLICGVRALFKEMRRRPILGGEKN